MEKFELVKNYRSKCKEYSDYLRKVGDGLVPRVMKDYISLDERLLASSMSLTEFINEVFPEELFKNKFLKQGKLVRTAIMTLLNEDVDEINDICLEKFPGRVFEMKGSDEIEYASKNQSSLRIPEKRLQNQAPKRWASHCLKLKKGMPLMLLKNLNVRNGLANGTKLRLLEIHSHYLLVETCSETFKRCFLHRCVFRSKEMGVVHKRL